MSGPPSPPNPHVPLTKVMRPERRFGTTHVLDYRYVLEDTMQPFEPGDVFLSCTYLNDPTDDHAGLGRILQYDATFKPKGVLWTQGHRHLLIGLRFDRQDVLWGFDIHTQAIVRVDRYGRQLPMHRFAHRAFGAAAFARDGSIYLAECLKGDTPYWGSHMEFVPGTNRIGDGFIYKFDRDWRHVETYPTETAPELSGFKGVTHLALHPSEQFMTYVTETGKRLMRYDLIAKRQMPDLARIDGGDLYDRNWFIAVDYLANGHLLVTRGDRVERYDESGQVVADYSLAQFGYGFAQVTVCADQRHALAANIFTGIACKWNLETGAIVAHVATDHAAPRRSLAGIAEFQPVTTG